LGESQTISSWHNFKSGETDGECCFACHGFERYGELCQVSPRSQPSGLVISGCRSNFTWLSQKSLVLPNEPLVFGIDETIERRWGQQISARGIYRDPIRSSQSHFVKTSGLRWMSVMLMAHIPWAERIWGLPVLSALAPSECYYQARGQQAKSLLERGKQLILQIRRWLPDQTLVFVGDSTYAALDLLSACQSLTHPVTFVTRLRMDAALCEPAPPYAGKARPRKKGKRLPTPQHYLDTDTTI
jgi:hypothetical protein